MNEATQQQPEEKTPHRIGREHGSQKCKRMASELRDELLFTQPKSTHLGDCPICFIPIPLDSDKYYINACCSKVICDGCRHKGRLMGNTKPTCPYCRTPIPETQAEADKNSMKRAEANDPVALRQMAKWGASSLNVSFECLARAAKLGDVEAHNQLSIIYLNGSGVDKDERKGIYHLEVAAIGGHPEARYNLAMHEWRNRKIDRSVKHLIIAANLGHDKSIQKLMVAYKAGWVDKEEFAAALRSHHAAVVAMKSPQREAARR